MRKRKTIVKEVERAPGRMKRGFGKEQVSENRLVMRARKISFLAPKSVGRVMGYESLGLLGLLSLALLFPTATNDTSALTNTTVNAEARVSVKAAASVAVSMANQVSIDVIPKSTGTFGYSSMRLGVSTNNEEGYQVFLRTGNGSNKLVNTDISKTGPAYEISSISNNMAGTAFDGNTWGYTLSQNAVSENSTYSPIPTSTTSIKTTTSASAGGEDVYNLGFGTHVSTDLPAGEYSNSVIVSVVANPIVISSLSQLVYMQDMKPEFCTNAEIGTTKQLYDVRDGKKYWVAKLADEHCWMTQNLALDLSTDKPLTPEDSDVESEWVPSRSTVTQLMNTSQYTANFSYNLGEYVYNPNTPTDANCTITAGEELSTCPAFTEVTEDSPGIDTHYLIGNYYQRFAAVRQGTEDQTICPANWTMPRRDDTINTYQSLFNFYKGINPTSEPLYFTLGGVGNGTTNLSSVGKQGFFWTASLKTGVTTILVITGTNPNPNANGGVAHYSAVRCVAK